MSLDDVVERLKGDAEERNKWVGVYIGVLAVILAICSNAGGNAAKDANRAHIEASNTWAFFQSKNIRRSTLSIAVDNLELALATQPGMSADARKKTQDKVKDYRDQIQKLTTDPVKKEGLDELFERGKSLEAARDVALRKDPYFDASQSLLQIAIVLASVHLIIGNLWLLALSGGLGFIGFLLMLDGMTLAVTLPFLG
jgi:hypothetical protein